MKKIYENDYKFFSSKTHQNKLVKTYVSIFVPWNYIRLKKIYTLKWVWFFAHWNCFDRSGLKRHRYSSHQSYVEESTSKRHLFSPFKFSLKKYSKMTYKFVYILFLTNGNDNDIKLTLIPRVVNVGWYVTKDRERWGNSRIS